MKKIILMIIAIIAGAGCSYGTSFDAWTAAYDKILKKNVSYAEKDGIKISVIDYFAVSKDSAFSKLFDDLSKLPSPETLNKKERLAFWINVYNFLTINKVIQKPSIKKLTDLNGLLKNVWKQNAGVVSGKKLTLDYIEHQIIRKKFKEPRIHFALVCAAVSCPDLRNEPYYGKKLEKQLKDQLNQFSANNKKGIKLDNNNKIIYVSKIFKWFGGDFDEDIKKWLHDQSIIDEKVRDTYSVKYFNYNWNLNSK